mmetsp:Transcript_25975/g.56940  ORF Transcript_25975/g.56940 Transcript_25975/m.56940 type:complete len:145 (-) Transcript_25975:899-1333(-)
MRKDCLKASGRKAPRQLRKQPTGNLCTRNAKLTTKMFSNVRSQRSIEAARTFIIASFKHLNITTARFVSRVIKKVNQSTTHFQSHIHICLSIVIIMTIGGTAVTKWLRIHASSVSNKFSQFRNLHLCIENKSICPSWFGIIRFL